MHRHILILFACLSPWFIGAQTVPVPVFVSGTEGYRSFRIPAIIRLPNRDLLAFAEGRTNSAADFGNLDIVMKRSRDNGRNWSALTVLVDNDSLQAGNPAPVVDRLDPAFAGGRIFLFYNTGNDHEGEVAKGKGLRECFYITSEDQGLSWSAPVNITRQVHRPLQPKQNPAYDFPDDWRTYANTPGHALQFAEGPYKGRLYVAANHSAGEPKPGALHYAAHGYFSDDHGRNFSISQNVPVPGSNEATAAELPGGGLLLNARNQHGNPRCRIVAFSKDGGAHWDTAYYDLRLPDPVCQGSLLNLGTGKGKALLAFCNLADTVKRDRLTLRISRDNGINWEKTILVDKAPGPGYPSYTAYCDLVTLGRRKIGVLYERNNYAEIVFAQIRW